MKPCRLWAMYGPALLLAVLLLPSVADAQGFTLDGELWSLDVGTNALSVQQTYVPGEPLPPGVQPPPYYRYRSGDKLPEGYHIEQRPTTGLLIAGYIVTGVPYAVGLLIALAAGFDNKSPWLLLPVVGPWITLGTRERACNEIGDSGFDSAYCFGDRTTEWLLGIDGVIQAIGGSLVALGFIVTRSYAVRDQVSYFVVPSPVGSGYGLKAVGWL